MTHEDGSESDSRSVVPPVIPPLQSLRRRRAVQWKRVCVSALAATSVSVLRPRLLVAMEQSAFRSPDPVATTTLRPDPVEVNVNLNQLQHQPHGPNDGWWFPLLGILVAVLTGAGWTCVHCQQQPQQDCHTSDKMPPDATAPILWHQWEGRIGTLIALLWFPTCGLVDHLVVSPHNGSLTLYLTAWSTMWCWMEWYIAYYDYFDKDANRSNPHPPNRHNTTWPHQCRLGLAAGVAILRWSLLAMWYLAHHDDWTTTTVLAIVAFVGMGVACAYVAWYGPSMNTWIAVLWTAVTTALLTMTKLGTFFVATHQWTALWTPWGCFFFVTTIQLGVCWTTIPSTKRPRSTRGTAMVILWFWHIVCTWTILCSWVVDAKGGTNAMVVANGVVGWVTVVNLVCSTILFGRHYQHGIGPLWESKMLLAMAVLWLAIPVTNNADHLFSVSPTLYLGVWGAFVIVYRQALRGWALALMLYFHTLDLSWLFLLVSSVVSGQAGWRIWMSQSADTSPILARTALLSGVVMSLAGWLSPWVFRQCHNPLARVQWRCLLMGMACTSFVALLCCDAHNMRDYGFDSLRWPTLYFSWMSTCSVTIYGALESAHTAHLQGAAIVPGDNHQESGECYIMLEDDNEDVVVTGKTTDVGWGVACLEAQILKHMSSE